MYLDDSACNLASLNLRKFQSSAAPASSTSRRSSSAVEITIIGAGDHRRQRQVPDRADRATTRTRFRPLGLGYANLGALLMSRGLPYD